MLAQIEPALPRLLGRDLHRRPPVLKLAARPAAAMASLSSQTYASNLLKHSSIINVNRDLHTSITHTSKENVQLHL